MSTTHTVNSTSTVTKTLAEYAKDVKEVYAKAEALEAEIEPAIKALNSLPKTPTGRTTKAVKMAEEALLEKRSSMAGAINRADSLLLGALRNAAKEFNSMHASPAVVTIAMERNGFIYDEVLTRTLLATSDKVRSYDEENRKDGYMSGGRSDRAYNSHVFIDEATRVYVKSATGEHVAVRFKREKDSGLSSCSYKIVHFGTAPIDGSFGPHFNRETNCYDLFSDSDTPLNSGRINLSAIGSEYALDCAKRLTTIVNYIHLSESLSNSCPMLSLRFSLLVLEDGIVDALANGETLLVVRKTAGYGLFGAEKHRVTAILTKDAARNAEADADIVTCGCITAESTYAHRAGDDEENKSSAN